MPYINSIKDYEKGGIYHVYNKTTHNLPLFYEESDQIKFLGLLYRYLVEPIAGITPRHQVYYDQIDLLCFTTMDNHLHLLPKQIKNNYALAEFMRSIIVSYTRYYNDKYKHIGSLFHGVYRGRKIENNLDLIRVSKYIHLNPSPDKPEDCLGYLYSSINNYTSDLNGHDFIKTDDILRHFGFSKERYKKFLLS